MAQLYPPTDREWKRSRALSGACPYQPKSSEWLARCAPVMTLSVVVLSTLQAPLILRESDTVSIETGDPVRSARRRDHLTLPLGVDADWVLRRLVEEAEADLADLYDDEGDLRPIADWPAIWRRGLVQGVEVETLYEGRGQGRIEIGRVKKIRLDNRVRHLEFIGKHVRVNAFQQQWPWPCGWAGRKAQSRSAGACCGSCHHRRVIVAQGERARRPPCLPRPVHTAALPLAAPVPAISDQRRRTRRRAG